MERDRYAELERIFMQESQILTQKDHQIQILEKEGQELHVENDRHKLRIQSKLLEIIKPTFRLAEPH